MESRKDNVKRSHISIFTPVNLLYYVLFALFFNYHFMRTTMFSSEHWYVYNDLFMEYYDKATNVLMVLAIFTIVFIIPDIRYKLFSAVLVAVCVLYDINREVINYRSILAIFLLVICAYGKSYKKIGIIALVSGWGWLIACFIASKTGYISDIVYRSGRSHSFGVVYSTDLMCHILTLVMVYLILRKGKLRIWEYGGLFAILAVNYMCIQAKIGFACLFLLVMGTMFYQYILPLYRTDPRIIRRLFAASCLSFLAFAALMFILTIKYTSDPSLIVNRFGFLKTIKLRFIYGKKALEENPITLWGTNIKEVGNGGVQEGTIDQSQYFFIDISYLRILLKNGPLIFISLMSVFLLAQIRLYRQKQYYAMFIMTVFALDCAVEHHIMEIAYSLLIYLAFCNVDGSVNYPRNIAGSWQPLLQERTLPSIRESITCRSEARNCP